MFYSQISVEKGGSITLTATVCPENASNKKLNWTSSNTCVATVHNGVVTARETGVARIYATAADGSGRRDFCIVTVTDDVLVTSITVTPSSKTMIKGSSTLLTAIVCPANATDQTVTWHSSHPNIATVIESSGLVMAQSVGTTTIYATANDGSGIQGSCLVTVNPATNYYHIVNKASGKVVNINGTNISSLTANQNVMIYESTGSNEQIWRIDEFSDQVQCFVKSLVDETFGLNVNKRLSNYLNCDVTRLSGNENDSAVYFIPQGNGYYYIQLANAIEDHCYFMTAKGTTNGSDIRWETAQESDLQLWYFESTEVIAPIPVERIEVSSETPTMNIGETQQLSADVFPEDATYKTVRWTSENSGIADVDSTGNVTAKAVGTTHIYATAQDGSRIQGSCKVTVNTPATKYYHIFNKESEMVVNIKGENLTSLTDGRNITLYRSTGSNEQIWRIDAIRENEACFIRSYIDETYGLNAYTAPEDNYNCTIHKISDNEDDAAVYFIKQEIEGKDYYKIQLAKHPGYKLTATNENNKPDIRWQTANKGDSQLWCFESVEIEPDPSEVPVEYHIVPVANETMALYANGYLLKRLDEDTSVILKDFSYMNRQKWTIQGTGTSKKLYSRHGDNFVLCKKSDGSNQVIVSNHATEGNSNLTFEQQNSGTNVYQIKLTNSNLYLTVSGNTVTWSTRNTSGNAQDWELREKPANIHNGCDTMARLDNQTIRAMKRDGNEFVVRYYGMIDKLDGLDITTTDINKTLGELKNKGFNLNVSDYSGYIDSIIKNNIEVKFVPKNLTSEEINLLRDQDIKIVSVYQNKGDALQHFSPEHAKLDAFAALISAKLLGQPEGTAIYFAVDFDPGNNLDIIETYFSTVKNIINGKYKIGVYGFGKVCNKIKQDCKYATYSWLGQAPGKDNYGGYDDVTKYTIKQAEHILYNNVTFDDCITAKDDYGQWRWEE